MNAQSDCRFNLLFSFQKKAFFNLYVRSKQLKINFYVSGTSISNSICVEQNLFDFGKFLGRKLIIPMFYRIPPKRVFFGLVH